MGGVEDERCVRSRRVGEWCLLRTKGRGTIKLAESLTEDGIEAWSPKMTTRIRLRRSYKSKEMTVPIMPSFVFARSACLDRLRQLEERPGRHSAFTIFRFMESIPLFADADLEPLHIAENRAPSPRRRRVYRPGQLVRIPEGSFAGMSGLVESGDGRFTLVSFGGAIRVKIATFLLRDDVASDAPRPGGLKDIAASAA